jgi:hypothetical protein
MSPKRVRTAASTAKKKRAQPFGGPVVWHRSPVVLEVAADRTLESVLRRMRAERADWVVVVRPRQTTSEVYYYAFRSSELERLWAEHPERSKWSIERAVDMHEWMASGTARGGKPLGPATGSYGPASARIVEFDTAGCIAAVGEREDLIPHAAAVDRDASDLTTIELDYEPGETRGGTGGGDGGGLSDVLDGTLRRDGGGGDRLGDILGGLLGRGGGGLGEAHGHTGGPPSPAGGEAAGPHRRSPPAAEIEVTLSAESQAEIRTGASAKVPFQIELTSEAMPLAASQPARARKDMPIVVSLSAENDAVEILRSHEFTVDPPGPGRPRTGFFTVKGVRSGVCRLAVVFRQGGSELGIIGLAVEVVRTGASTEKAKGQEVAAPRDFADDDKLALLVEQRVDGGQIFYDYTLHSEALGLPYRRLHSKPLLDRGGGPAATVLTFVERIYERVTKELKSFDDLTQLQRETRALGASLCQELFDPDVAKVLWPLRDRIKLVQIVSWEPYIPWELLRLQDPLSGEIDDRFLCEYGLVRTLSDEMPPRALQMGRWAYLGSSFPMGSFPPVGAELDYFTKRSPESLQGHGIMPMAIAATRDAFYDVLAEGDFDVLHISCHAESPHQSIERASLIIGDETPAGDTRPRLVAVDTITVEAEARLRQRRPLVFLNACETGRVGAVLTAWGGWPNVFLRKGAGAFVGSAWAVRDKPAAAFSTSFYNALLDGRTLAEAASAARAAAKKLGDASWLAFKVYGHPRAQRAQA